MARRKVNLFNAACLCCLWLSALAGVGQTIAPPIAEYRGKAQGMFELKNDGDVPLAVILEFQGFQVDEDGNIRYEAIDPGLKVETGANSFVIPPHQSHLVFYRARTDKAYAWFAVLNTLTRAASEQNRMRINFVLPHVVYLYQRQKFKKEDLSLTILPGSKDGEYRLDIENHSGKLGRVEDVAWDGCENNGESGGFPMFPEGKRRLRLQTGKPSPKAKVKVVFQDGFTLQVPFK